MNRQLRRANEKSDKRRERDQEKRKEQKRASRSRAASKPKPSKTPRGDSSEPRRARGRFPEWLKTGYLAFVIFTILMQAVIPSPSDTFSLVIHAFFYVILGYFLLDWLYKRGVGQALFVTLGVGVALALGVEGLKILLPLLGLPAFTGPEGTTTDPNLVFVLTALPGLLAGTFLGQAVQRRQSS